VPDTFHADNSRCRRTLLTATITNVNNASQAYCSQTGPIPIPFRITDRTMIRKNFVGWTFAMTWRKMGMLLIGKINPDNKKLGRRDEKIDRKNAIC
jgi:hypothetical protein